MKRLAIIFLFSPIAAGSQAIMANHRRPLEDSIAAHFSSGEALTAFAWNRPVLIENAILKNADIYKTELAEATFANTELSDVDATAAIFGSIQFKDSLIQNSTFRLSKITEATFVNVQLINVDFSGSSINKARFVNCEINNTNFTELNESAIEISDSTIIDTTFYRAKASLRIDDTSIENLKLRAMHAAESAAPIEISVVRSKGKWLSASYSKLGKLSILDSELRDVSVAAANIGKVELRDSSLDIGFDSAVIGSIHAANFHSPNLGLVGAKIGSIHVKGCRPGSDIGMIDTKFDLLSISGCVDTSLVMPGATGNTAKIERSRFNQARLGKLAIDELSLSNIRFSNKLDTRGSLINELRTQAVEIAPGTEVFDENSTMQF